MAAFRATLEEAADADLLLHVIDASHPDRERMIAAVMRVLEQVGALEVPRLEVYNKVDQLPDDERTALERAATGPAVHLGPDRRRACRRWSRRWPPLWRSIASA